MSVLGRFRANVVSALASVASFAGFRPAPVPESKFAAAGFPAGRGCARRRRRCCGSRRRLSDTQRRIRASRRSRWAHVRAAAVL
jgi:hypothetical protein